MRQAGSSVLISPVIQDVMQQRCDGRTLGGGLFIQETPGAVLAHYKLLKHNTEDLTTPNRPVMNIIDMKKINAVHLQRFVKPAVSTVGERPASVQNLRCLTAGVPVSQRVEQTKITM